MCTCMTLQKGDFYFGRNLDLDCSFGEQVIVTPRNYRAPSADRKIPEMHLAMIGMGTVCEGYPLYAEAVNEEGLAMAALYFPGEARYLSPQEDAKDVASFELILWILGNCANVSQAERLLEHVRITDRAFSEAMQPQPLHWMLADSTRCLVLEPLADGLHLYENSYGVLTNSPGFCFHQTNLRQYLQMTAKPAEQRFSDRIRLIPYGEGAGGFGLPGDASPASRFVKAVFLRENAVCGERTEDVVTQFFHILDNVAMPRGMVVTEEGKYDATIYSCCANTRTGVYYYKTYENSQIEAVGLQEHELDERHLVCYPLVKRQQIFRRKRKEISYGK